mmetsp:Transcript_31983/g.71071  ORF Transcript_31983/g.71071 Transcript_31983/m.71071 type:complete len:168 (-) Transcript_31983:312-815(-)
MDPNLAAWFKAVDTSGEGLVDAKEVQKALEMGGLKFSLTDVDSMIRAFDNTGKRSLNVEEFARLHGFLMSCNNSFYSFDADRSGHLNSTEAQQALAQAGFRLDKPAFDAIFNKHDPNKASNIELTEFVRLCLSLQTAARAFAAFDPQRTGKVTLSFDQFVYAASHLA